MSFIAKDFTDKPKPLDELRFLFVCCVLRQLNLAGNPLVLLTIEKK